MSREQWGHGYHTGVEAAKHQAPNYCVTFTESNNVESVFIVQEVHGNTYVLEAIPYLWFICHGFAEPEKEPIVSANIYEKTGNELGNHKFYWTWHSVIKELKKDKLFSRKE